MSRINICVCTCHRGELLKACLESLARVRVSDEIDLTVSIIDNDAKRSAEAVVNSVKKDFPFPLKYFCESKRGIPCARNRAIDETVAMGSDYLVFIDDDEWVETEWLQMLYGFCKQNGGNVVVSGGVVAELPKGTPPEIAGLFNRKASGFLGQRLETCATNNVLVPMHLLLEAGQRFDESKPLVGGTDTIFFKELTNKGVVILRCPQALVHELIPEKRATLQWLLKRKYRVGITEAVRKRMSGRSALSILVSAVFQLLVEALKVLLASLANKKMLRNQSVLKLYRCAGIVSGVVGVEVDSYRVID